MQTPPITASGKRRLGLWAGALAAPVLLLSWLALYAGTCWSLLIPALLAAIIARGHYRIAIHRRQYRAAYYFNQASLAHRLLTGPIFVSLSSLLAGLTYAVSLCLFAALGSALDWAFLFGASAVVFMLYRPGLWFAERSLRDEVAPLMLKRLLSLAAFVVLAAAYVASYFQIAVPDYLDPLSLNNTLARAIARTGSFCPLIDDALTVAQSLTATAWFYMVYGSSQLQQPWLRTVGWLFFLAYASISLMGMCRLAAEFVPSNPQATPQRANQHSPLDKTSAQWRWPGFWTGLFATIVVLILLQGIAVVSAHRHAPSDSDLAAGRQYVIDMMVRFNEQALGASFPDTEKLIDASVDRAFAPVYGNISTFADWHYSVTGQYLELFFAATGQLSGKIHDMLLEGFEERLARAQLAVGAGFLAELREHSARLLSESTADGDAENQRARLAAIDLALSDMHRRFETTGLAVKGTGALGGGVGAVMATKAIVAAITKKTVALTAAKTAGKLAIKSASVAGGAATGAAAGSVVPGAGTAIGGVVGGVTGWLAIDKAVVETDQYFNRAQFELELAAAIDEQRELLKARIRQQLKTTIDDVLNQTPARLIKGA